MGESTAISWATSTFNPWWQCTEVPTDPACDNCYARTLAHRYGYGWGVEARRRFFGEKHWTEPFRWNRKAAESGEPWRVFCASMGDVFESLPRDHPDRVQMEAERARLWTLIERTPNLTWLLLTKRPGSIPHMVPGGWMTGYWPRNAWVGTTTVTQGWLEKRAPLIARIPAPVRFLSVEPMLEPLDVRTWIDAFERTPINWVIAGSESGHDARPCSLDWVRSLRDQCAMNGVAFHWKQHTVGGVVIHTPELDGRRWTEFPAGRAGQGVMEL